ncbi:MAG: shikimate dehydrogenase [Firmicutes bacterium]|nr:shikimate dehydrogenase [Bacillota bacterium]
MRLDAETKLLGLLGSPVRQSLSPAMHNAAFEALKLNFCYLAFDVKHSELATILKALVPLGFVGVNVTAPHKEAVISFLDCLSPEANSLGAVNTIKNIDGKLHGFNTDVYGFQYLLNKNFSKENLIGKICLLGAGGAAKAVSLALLKSGVNSLAIFNRSYSRAQELIHLFKKDELNIPEIKVFPLTREYLNNELADASIIINALSIDPFELGLMPAKISESIKGVIDLRYNPPLSQFLMWAQNQNVQAINGLDMLLGQGIKAFEIFTGLPAPQKIMENALVKSLARD